MVTPNQQETMMRLLPASALALNFASPVSDWTWDAPYERGFCHRSD